MTSKSPIFPIKQPHHFSDYGFDPQIDYFQVLEEARNHKLNSSSFKSAIDNFHFKLHFKDNCSKKIKKTRKRWWNNALHFFKRIRTCTSNDNTLNSVYCGSGVGALSGPVYLVESRSGSSTPHHRTSCSRPSSGSLKGDMNIPYISLNEVNMDEADHRISVSPMPIYLVT